MAHIRAVVVIWAVWAWLTALAYLNGPEIFHLQPVDNIIAPQWWSWLWGAAAALLTLGLVPWRGAGWARVAGLAVIAGLCTAWSLSFTLTWIGGETTRGWVSAKNYGAQAALAMVTAWWVAVRGRFDQ